MPSGQEAFLGFLRAIDCLPITKRKRRPNSSKIVFLTNWTALVAALCIGCCLGGFALNDWIWRKHLCASISAEKAWREIYREFFEKS